MAKRKYKKYRKYGKKKNDLELFIGIIVIVIFLGIVNQVKTNLSNILETITFPLIIILIIIALIFVLKIFYTNYQKDRSLNRKFTLDELRSRYKSKPTDFEHYIAHIYKQLGYKTKVTPESNDYGKDIIMRKNGKKYVVEVKLYADHNRISREHIQKFHSSMIEAKADKGIFVTTSSFKRTAVDWAKKFNIDLIDGKKLVKLIDSTKNN